jgi:hypothetical protein
MRRFALLVCAVAVCRGSRARAQAAPPADDTAAEDQVDAGNDSAGYTPPEAALAASAFHINGYVDVGFAKAQGNGTSFPALDAGIPADYGVDTFAPAVNSRGDVASTDPGDDRFLNGFLPRSVGIGGRPSFLINTLDLDLRYQTPGTPVMIFSRVQFLPRLSSTGDASRFYVEQAFGRVMPFDLQELALSLGKFDSVFGIEYQDNEANIRTGVTPSLAARYTTGQSVGAKLFYRLQLGPLWSALSVNLAATNSGNMVESLQASDASLAGGPVFSGRAGYELNLRPLQIKLGGSALRGPRNDQRDRDALQKMWGADARVFAAGFALAGEYVHVDEDEGVGPKITSLGTFPLASGFHARAYWGQLAYAWSIDSGILRRVTPYARYERRHAWFEGFTPILVDRITWGLRVDLWESLILKGEVLVNRELQGAPNVPNNVYTSSAVYQW